MKGTRQITDMPGGDSIRPAAASAIANQMNGKQAKLRLNVLHVRELRPRGAAPDYLLFALPTFGTSMPRAVAREI
jgi:hypothetical protein